MNRRFYVYMLTNSNNTTLYTGMTNNLERRMQEHHERRGSKFCVCYNLTKLVYFEEFSTAYEAIAAEKKIKSRNRSRKNKLIEEQNPNWEEIHLR
jgi:putative endonuclease